MARVKVYGGTLNIGSQVMILSGRLHHWYPACLFHYLDCHPHQYRLSCGTGKASLVSRTLTEKTSDGQLVTSVLVLFAAMGLERCLRRIEIWSPSVGLGGKNHLKVPR